MWILAFVGGLFFMADEGAIVAEVMRLLAQQKQTEASIGDAIVGTRGSDGRYEITIRGSAVVIGNVDNLGPSYRAGTPVIIANPEGGPRAHIIGAKGNKDIVAAGDFTVSRDFAGLQRPEPLMVVYGIIGTVGDFGLHGIGLYHPVTGETLSFPYATPRDINGNRTRATDVLMYDHGVGPLMVMVNTTLAFGSPPSSGSGMYIYKFPTFTLQSQFLTDTDAEEIHADRAHSVRLSFESGGGIYLTEYGAAGNLLVRGDASESGFVVTNSFAISFGEVLGDLAVSDKVYVWKSDDIFGHRTINVYTRSGATFTDDGTFFTAPVPSDFATLDERGHHAYAIEVDTDGNVYALYPANIDSIVTSANWVLKRFTPAGLATHQVSLDRWPSSGQAAVSLHLQDGVIYALFGRDALMEIFESRNLNLISATILGTNPDDLPGQNQSVTIVQTIAP